MNVIFEEVKCPDDRSPIFFANLTAEILKGNSKKPMIRKVEGLVVKGTIEEIKRSDRTKTRFLKSLFSKESAAKKKVHAFDLSKVSITSVEIVKSLGYGVK